MTTFTFYRVITKGAYRYSEIIGTVKATDLDTAKKVFANTNPDLATKVKFIRWGK